MHTMAKKSQDAPHDRLLWTVMESPVGNVLIVVSDVGMRRVEFVDDDNFEINLKQSRGMKTSDAQRDLLKRSNDELHQYFLGKRTEFSVPLDINGTEFQKRAWDALLQIPFGQTRSYLEQAKMIGQPSAVRAVGSANSKNPVAIVVPCHRVIASSGALSGYAGGIDKKTWLLQHEKMATAA